MNEILISLLNSYLKENSLVKHQIDSYNDFVIRRIPKILKGIGTVEPKVPAIGDLKLKIGRFRVGKEGWAPWIMEADGSERQILPQEARIRNLTYSTTMWVEITPVLNKVEGEPQWINFGELPIMVKSKICPLSTMSKAQLLEVGEDPDDPGGYFIINGTERILVLVEEIVQNHILVKKVDSGNVTEIARIHSEKDGYVQRHLMERRKNGVITISFANVLQLSIVTLLKALGLESDKEIITTISPDPTIQDEFYINLLESEITTQDEALDAITGKYLRALPKAQRIERACRIIDTYFLPHLGQNPEDRTKKAIFLSKAIEKLIKLHLGKIEEDDLDHYANKRLKLAGDLLEIQLRSILLGKYGLIPRISYNYQKLTKRGRLPPLQAIIESNVLTNQLISALAIGTWTGGRTGISQRLERGSFVKTISHMRNILSPLTSAQEHFEARELHPTHFGKLCISETPEGATIGLRKYLALLAEITKGVSDEEQQVVSRIVRGEKVG
ncbi:MAG: DNA-directed RNA polymerase subunit B'' [Candidatus Aenigmarchaeota archaeon]|nr:DNA-directed RNA polymerase subunit B'' [Candidatus Aenigmarchaeota archaeon]